MASMTSFEILPMPSYSEQDDHILIEDVAIPIASNSTSLASDTSSREEIWVHLKSLVDENNTLKERLRMKSEMMHEHLNAISTMHDEIAETSSKQRYMLENSVQKVEILEQEKLELSEQIKVMETLQHEKKLLLGKVKSIQEENEVLLENVKELEVLKHEKGALLEKVKCLETVKHEKEVLLEKVKEQEAIKREMVALLAKVKELETIEHEKEALLEKVKDLETVRQEKDLLSTQVKELETVQYEKQQMCDQIKVLEDSLLQEKSRHMDIPQRNLSLAENMPSVSRLSLKIEEVKNLDEPCVEPKVLTQYKTISVKENYNMNKMINKEGSVHHSLHAQLCTDTSILQQGYDALAEFHAVSKREKFSKSITQKCFIIGTYIVSVVKEYRIRKDIENDIITPKRFAGVLTLAAARHWSEAWEGKSVDKMKELSTLVNPYGIVHGFKPDRVTKMDGELEVIDEDLTKMMLLYLCTTIGFENLMYMYPAGCLAVAEWRGDEVNAVRLGLSRALEDPSERFMRLKLGIITKTFMYKNALVGLVDIVEDEDFLKEFKEWMSILKNYSKVMGHGGRS